MQFSENDFSLPPFPGFPSTNRYVSLGPVSEAVNRVARSVFAREAISLIIGPSGTGKSLTGALLAQEFGETFDVVCLGETRIDSVKTLHRLLLHRLGVPTEAATSDAFELMIHDRLCGPSANENGCVVIIDEAAGLSEEILEAIRGITNLMRNGRPMVSAVVMGGPRLDDTLAAPRMEPFVQRVAARCYLHALNSDETRQYVRESIQACNASAEETITDAALSSIFHATGGVPRLINQLMTEAIDCAAESDKTAIDELVVDQAWAQLQQLPSPLPEDPALAPAPSSIEFGELEPMTSAEPSGMEETFAEAASLVNEALETLEPNSLPPESFAAFEPDSAPVASAAEFSPLPPSAAELLSLFGNFDQEESIPVVIAESGSNDRCHENVPGCNPAENPAVNQNMTESTDSELTDDDIIDAISIPLDSEAALDQAATPERDAVPGILWYDEPVTEESEAVAQDDSDLLWICEDVDVERRIDQPAAGPSPHFPVVAAPPGEVSFDVDYRAMLQKMRHHS